MITPLTTSGEQRSTVFHFTYKQKIKLNRSSYYWVQIKLVSSVVIWAHENILSKNKCQKWMSDWQHLLYVKSSPAKFHPDPMILNDGFLVFLKTVCLNKENKTSSDMRSVADVKTLDLRLDLTPFVRIHPVNCQLLFWKWWVNISSSVSRCVELYNRYITILTLLSAQHYTCSVDISSIFVACIIRSVAGLLSSHITQHNFECPMPRSSAHSGDSSTQRPTLSSWPSIWSFATRRPELATRWRRRRRRRRRCFFWGEGVGGQQGSKEQI